TLSHFECYKLSHFDRTATEVMDFLAFVSGKGELFIFLWAPKFYLSSLLSVSGLFLVFTIGVHFPANANYLRSSLSHT
ncbi:MAG: hypothetical protein WCL71_18135, partial [Deltaproteobacteria bacterium]